MTKLTRFLVVLFSFIGLLILAPTLAAQSETAKKFYNRHLREAETLKEEAEREVRYGDVAKKYRELVDKAVEWEKKGFEWYGESPDLPGPNGDAYFKST